MPNDYLPIGPMGEGETRYPAPADGLPSIRQASVLSADVRTQDRSEDRDEIDLLAYARILLKRRWLILSVLGAVVALALIVTLLTPPTYRATTILQIDMEDQKAASGVAQTSPSDVLNPQFLQTQYELLKSRALAERVVDELGIDRAMLDSLHRVSWLDRLKSLIRPAPLKTAKSIAGDAAAVHLEAANAVLDGLSVEPVRNSRLVKVSFDSAVPSLSARVINAVAEGFIATGMERRFGASSYTKTFLEQQLKLTKSRLEDSERQLVRFAQQQNLISNSDGQSLAGQNLSDLNTALATAQAQRIRAQARWRQAQAAHGAALPADMLSDSILHTLQEQRAQLQGQYEEKLQVLGANYPEMRQMKSRIDLLDKQIGTELGNIRASVKAEYDAAASQENLLIGQLSALRTQALDVDGRSIQYNILKREVDTNRQLYDGLLQRFKEAGVAGDVRSNNISIIDRALVPTSRFKPSVSLNVAIGTLLGLLLGVLVAFVLEFLDDTLKTPDDIEQRLRLAVLGIIPRLAKQTPADAARDPRSAFSESYRSVRTALQFSTEDGVPKVLLVTSPGASEGKSTTALALARNFAQMGKRVLLIDADLRNPSLHRDLSLRSDVGLSSLLAGVSNLIDVVLDTDDERLKVILAGQLPPNPAELLSGSKLISLLTITSQHYDQIVIDGPPVMGISDAPILANAAQATLLVIQSGKTRIKSAEIALKRLLAARAHVLGAVVTQYDAKVAGYGYNYEGYYAYGGTPTPLLAKR